MAQTAVASPVHWSGPGNDEGVQRVGCADALPLQRAHLTGARSCSCSCAARMRPPSQLAGSASVLGRSRSAAAVTRSLVCGVGTGHGGGARCTERSLGRVFRGAKVGGYRCGHGVQACHRSACLCYGIQGVAPRDPRPLQQEPDAAVRNFITCAPIAAQGASIEPAGVVSLLCRGFVCNGTLNALSQYNHLFVSVGLPMTILPRPSQ